MEQKDIIVKKHNGKVFLNEEEIDILSIFSYNKDSTKELTLWKELLYTNDMDRYVLDIIYSLQALVTKDNREEFNEINLSLNQDFNEFTERISKRFVARQEATRTYPSLEN